MAWLLLILALGPADCEMVIDWLGDCPQYVLRGGHCQHVSSWFCHLGHDPHWIPSSP